jgi:hypothetical protein
MTEYDPHSRFEDEGIPDMQDGTPQQQWAVDPQEAPLPGDSPMAVDDYGTTVEEEIQGESLEGRLRREVPEEQPAFGADEETSEETGGRDGATWTDEDARTDAAEQPETETRYDAADAAAEEWPGQPEEPSGTVWEEPRPAGRLVDPDQGLGPDEEPDLIADEVGPDRGGFTAEESAMRVEPE